MVPKVESEIELQSKFVSRQNFLFQDIKEKFGGKKIYFANEQGASEISTTERKIWPPCPKPKMKMKMKNEQIIKELSRAQGHQQQIR